MGINLADIVAPEPRALEDFSGKILAIDAFNTLYQFLAIIRQPDGTPLMDHQGRVTSHLSGLIYRLSNFVAVGIKPVFVFDGEPPRLKARTLVARGEVKQRAEREWREAVEIGDLATARTKAMQTSRLTDEMVEQSKKLLDLLGLPWVQAPAEGEAQASAMARAGIAYAAASQDFDSLLFGSPRLVKNLALSGRRKLPGKDVYVDVHIESKEEVRGICLHPKVIEDVEIEFRDPDAEGVRRMLCDEHDFSRDRIDAALEKFGSARSEQKQRSLDSWFA